MPLFTCCSGGFYNFALIGMNPGQALREDSSDGLVFLKDPETLHPPLVSTGKPVLMRHSQSRPPLVKAGNLVFMKVGKSHFIRRIFLYRPGSKTEPKNDPLSNSSVSSRVRS